MTDELMRSMQRLEATGISLAMRGARAQLLRNDSMVAWKTGAVVWTAGELLTYVTSDERERHIIRTLKGIR